MKYIRTLALCLIILGICRCDKGDSLYSSTASEEEWNGSVVLLADFYTKTESGNKLIATRSNQRANDKGLVIVKRNEQVLVDFSRTETQGLALQFRIGLQGQAMRDVGINSIQFFDEEPGDYLLRLEAINQHGNTVASKSFFVSVTCENPTLLVDGSEISVTRDPAVDNRFVYSFGPNFVKGGKGTYEIQADVNGDGIFDFDWFRLGTFSAYTVDATTNEIPGASKRIVSIQVRDSSCRARAIATREVSFDIPRSDADPSKLQAPQRPGYRFFEALIADPSAEDARKHFDYNAAVNSATESAPVGPTLSCEFDKGTGRVALLTKMDYPLNESLANSSNKNSHGFTQFNFTLKNFSVSGGTYNSSATVTYNTTGRDDSGLGRAIYTTAACPVKVVTNTISAGTPGACNRIGTSTQGTQATPVKTIFDGTFSCGELRAADASKIAVTKGAFVCESQKYSVPQSCELPPIVCGDGKVEAGESCDLGSQNGVPNSGCSATCTTSAICGNGTVESGETCDKGLANGVVGSLCSSSCQSVAAVCGNSVREAGEECDIGAQNGVAGSGCTSSCKLPAVCGNSKIEDGEECDKGTQNGVLGTGCDKSCRRVAAVCGNGVIDAGSSERCDNGALNGTAGNPCTSSCQPVPVIPVCGDGKREGSEQCDDGAANGQPSSSGVYCSRSCVVIRPPAPVCGDGKKEGSEQCDDGAANGQPSASGVYCSRSCAIVRPPAPVCGDGKKEGSEQCDNGAANGQPSSSGVYCSRSCAIVRPQ